MQYSTLLSLAAFVAGISAENLLVLLNSDVNANLNEYLGYVQSNTAADVGPLLSIYRQAQTYTDESYTTLVNDQELAEISSFAADLPWYSSRIEGNLDAAPATSSVAVSSSVVPVTSSAVESSASASASSASSSASSESESSVSSAHSSSVESLVSSHSEEHSSSTHASASATSTGAAAYLAPGVGLFALGAVALL